MQNILPGESAGMPQDVSGMPQDDTMMQLELQRRMKFADALRQQEAPQGQMVLGHYVAPSWTQQLAGLANKYVAGQQEQNAMKQYGDYQAAKSAKLADLLAGKETGTTTDYNEAGNIPGVFESKRIPYTQQEFMSKASQILPGMSEDLVKSKLAQYVKGNEPVKLGKDEAIGTYDAVKGFVPSYTNVSDKDKYTNIHEDKEGNSVGFNRITQRVEKIPGDKMAVEQWSAPYTLNGQSVQKNLITGKIDQAVHLPATTQVNMPKVEQSARIEANKDFQEKVYRPTMDSARQNTVVLSRLDALEKLPINEQTGWGTQAKSAAYNVLLGMGYKSDEAKAMAGDAQTFKAIQARQVNDELNMAKGPQTEGDSIRAAQTVASLGNTPDANKFINSLQRAIIKRKNAEADFYRKNYGKALADGDLSVLERNWMDSPEAAKSIFDYPEMKAWTNVKGGNAPAGQDYHSKYGLTPAPTHTRTLIWD